MTLREDVANSLAECVRRLDTLLVPWGFAFVADAVMPSHGGPFASGHYCRGETRIGVSCRETIDNIYYQHSFVHKQLYFRETTSYTIGHETLMQAVGHYGDCRLIRSNDVHDAIIARDGGDRVAALIYDLRVFAESLLREPCEEFYEIVRLGYRGYSVS